MLRSSQRSLAPQPATACSSHGIVLFVVSKSSCSRPADLSPKFPSCNLECPSKRRTLLGVMYPRVCWFLLQGTLDSSILTEEGISQALEAGKTLASYADLDLGPTVVVSPMGRAQQTLECVRQELRKSEISKDFETVEIVPDIREIELFEW